MVNQRPGVFLFVGTDEYLKEKAIKELSSSLLDDSNKDLDYKVFYGAETAPREALDHINTVPFFASRKLVVIKGFDKAPDELKERLVNYARKPLKSTCLVLESSGDSILKDYPEILKYASLRRFGDLTGRESALWFKEFLSERKKKMTPEAVALLKESRGRDMMALTQELEKLASYTGGRPEIGSSDVEAVVGKSLIASTFDLADAIGSGKAARALQICHDLITAGKKEYEIIGLLCWHFKRIMKAKAMRSRGEGDNRIALALRIGQKYWPGFFKQVSGLTMAGIKSRITALLEADLDIKRTRFDQTLVLEFAVIKLCSGRASS
jgi:DNA polymerase-3 subunit delta